jgi:hypothetical protein
MKVQVGQTFFWRFFIFFQNVPDMFKEASKYHPLSYDPST